MELLEKIKKEINDFCLREYDAPADFSNLHRVNIAYTDSIDGLHDLQVYLDLIDHKVFYLTDEEISEETDLIDDHGVYNYVCWMDFNSFFDYYDPGEEFFEEEYTKTMSDVKEIIRKKEESWMNLKSFGMT